MLSFQGRLARLPYFGYSIVAFVVILVAAGFAGAISPSDQVSGAGMIVLLLGVVASAWISLAAGARRCHDFGQPGWFIATTFIPIVGPFFGLYILFKAGDPRPNQYGDGGFGPSPRDLHNQQFHPEKVGAPF